MDILISGVGGQGTVLASKVLADSRVIEGGRARTGETIGMSQRGGSVISHVRTGESYSAFIPVGGADLLLSFELIEGARNISYLKEGAHAVINTALINPVSAILGKESCDKEEIMEYISANSNVFFIDASKLAREAGSIRVVNTILIGFAYGLGLLDLSGESIEKSMSKNIRAEYLDLNLKAFRSGIKSAEGVHLN
jgi:indolepyruvate ferredoxin oxidoreductase beta subunit